MGGDTITTTDKEKTRKEILEEYQLLVEVNRVVQRKQKYYDLKDICLYFDISPSMVEAMRKHGELPNGSVKKIGRLWRYDREKLERVWGRTYDSTVKG